MSELRKAVPLAPYTTFKIGGSAEYFGEVHTEKELADLLLTARQMSLPVTVLGGGSNVLISDDGIEGLVINNLITGITSNIEEERVVSLRVGGGEVFDQIVAYTVERGWWGLENLSHIPGLVGATPIQNVGAYGVEVAELISVVEAVHVKTGEEKTFTHNECQFAYRDSYFKSVAGKEWVVTAVTFKLSSTPHPRLDYRDLKLRFENNPNPSQIAIRDAVIAIRSGKFPDWQSVGTAGSFFKNPIISASHYKELLLKYPALPGYFTDDTEAKVKVPLGWVLENICHMKGVYEGRVGCYEGQALVLVQTGGATTNNVLDFANYIADLVYQKTNIEIEREVTYIGKNFEV